VLGIDEFARFVPDDTDSMVVVKLAKGVTTEEAQPILEKTVKPFGTAKVQTVDDYKKQIGSLFDVILTMIIGLLALAIVIALLGIANTIALSVLERTRELGLLRAVGMSRRQLRSTIRWESVIIALFGAALGLVLGVLGAWGMVEALRDEGFEVFRLPLPTLIVVALVAGILGMVAAVVPAWRAGPPRGPRGHPLRVAGSAPAGRTEVRRIFPAGTAGQGVSVGDVAASQRKIAPHARVRGRWTERAERAGLGTTWWARTSRTGQGPVMRTRGVTSSAGTWGWSTPCAGARACTTTPRPRSTRSCGCGWPSTCPASAHPRPSADGSPPRPGRCASPPSAPPPAAATPPRRWAPWARSSSCGTLPPRSSASVRRPPVGRGLSGPAARRRRGRRSSVALHRRRRARC
jgi:putative transposon-encoded protein